MTGVQTCALPICVCMDSVEGFVDSSVTSCHVAFSLSPHIRIFSLHVPLASTTFVSLIYKPSPGVTVSLELKTGDAPLCTQEGAQDIMSESRTRPPAGRSAS